MYVTLEELKEINTIQIEILKEVSTICKALDIVFCVVHGSLLGAVRSNGFIPYDDDIDIAMKRLDYEKFLREAPNLMQQHYFLQSNHSDKYYSLPFAKVRDTRTTYICEAFKNLDINHGIYIDIFPVDNVPAKKNIGEEWKNKMLSKRISASYFHPNRSIRDDVINVVLRLLFPSLAKATEKRNTMYAKHPYTGWVCVQGGKTVEQAIPATWFDSLIPGEFEGVSVLYPSGYDAYLKCIYGEYEKETLVEGKMSGNKVALNACIIDTKRSYADYRNKKSVSNSLNTTI